MLPAFQADNTFFTLFPEQYKALNLLLHLHLVGGLYTFASEIADK